MGRGMQELRHERIVQLMFDLFFLNIHRDELLAVQCIQSIRRHYPDAPILAISDGPLRRKLLAPLDDVQNLEIIQGDLLKYNSAIRQPPTTAHIRRNLTTILERVPTGRIIKLDPDSYVWRQARYCPDSYWAGTVSFGYHGKSFSHGLRFCHGGAWMMRTELMYEILTSGLLESRFLNNPFIKGEDPVYGWIANELQVSPVAWREVFSSRLDEEKEQWKIQPYLFAITHPVHLGSLESDSAKQEQPA